MISVDGGGTRQAIANAFVGARQGAGRLAEYPGPVPSSLDEAYAIQDHAIAIAPDRIAGWKVGRIPSPLDSRFGTNRLAGPIFAASILAATPEALAMPIFAGGFAAVEAEFLLRIGTAPDPAKRDYTMEEASALIDAVHVGIEIASSPFSGINALGPAVTVSDFGNNNGLVVGPKIENWQDFGFLDWPLHVLVDGQEVGSGRANAMLDGPIGAARFLFELIAMRGITLSSGQWISSGAVTGVHQVEPGARVEARFGDKFEVSCTVEAAV